MWRRCVEEPVTIPRVSARRLRYLGFAASLVLALGAFCMRDALAGEVMLDVGFWLNQRALASIKSSRPKASPRRSGSKGRSACS